MTEQRFSCTACGACCYGLLPLTVDEALKSAHRFPLAMAITPIKPGARGYRSAGSISASVVLPSKKTALLLVTPVSFIPTSMPCPELAGDNLCSIHIDKPVRCKAMPFYAYKDEDHQRDMLVPRAGWQCETSADAPVVYRDQKIVDRGDFDEERNALLQQAPALRRHVELLFKHDTVFSTRVVKATQAPLAGRVVIGFVSFLRYNKELNLMDFARKQQPVLESWARKTAGDAKVAQFHQYYREAVSDLDRYISV
ncbi:YkgJ family cysteine cluster protein [Rhizobium sp. PL01]|uniref:YkgJ family cysteine cluster protein n=1 Tax=Rhizobium sp. PL01 TaxID=3085631 RepID=UPI00298295F4|nr:YkgJ family cysteine cluster protein [Rhizobium sp. PL01]MDW5317602.1 YkgJ family cysteine cluster protein [Rhizobium sp. PL01]